MSVTAKKLLETLGKQIRLTTLPVGVKLARKGAYRYPVPNLSALSEPKIPRGYFQVDAAKASS